jgi:hypothetical protein
VSSSGRRWKRSDPQFGGSAWQPHRRSVPRATLRSDSNANDLLKFGLGIVRARTLGVQTCLWSTLGEINSCLVGRSVLPLVSSQDNSV